MSAVLMSFRSLKEKLNAILIGISEFSYDSDFRKTLREEGLSVDEVCDSICDMLRGDLRGLVEALEARYTKVLNRLGADYVRGVMDTVVNEILRLTLISSRQLAYVYVPCYELPSKLRVIRPRVPGLFISISRSRGSFIKRDLRETLRAYPAVAVVGTRQPSQDGCEMARRIGRLIAEHGIALVTGLAEGIDLCALNGFLEVSGPPTPNVAIAVRPFIYPQDKVVPLKAREVLERHKRPVVLVSEKFFPYTSEKYIKVALCLRNRIIAGLADLVVVVEARARGKRDVRRCGSMAMIKFGLEVDKPVLVWNTKSQNPEIRLALELYKKHGATVFEDEHDFTQNITKEFIRTYEVVEKGKRRAYGLMYFFKPTITKGYGFNIYDKIEPLRRSRTIYFYGKVKERNLQVLRSHLGERFFDALYCVGAYYITITTPIPGVYEPQQQYMPWQDVTSLVHQLKGSQSSEGSQELSLGWIDMVSDILSRMTDLHEDELGGVDAITYVPCHSDNYRVAIETRERVCVPEEIAKRLSNYMKKPLVQLVEKKYHVELREISDYSERCKVAGEMYKPIPTNINNVRSLMLIDDVFTSGCTMNTVAMIIKKYHKVERVYGVVLAVASARLLR